MHIHKPLAIAFIIAASLIGCNQQQSNSTPASISNAEKSFFEVGKSYVILGPQPMPIKVKIQSITNNEIIGTLATGSAIIDPSVYEAGANQNSEIMVRINNIFSAIKVK